MNSNAHMLGSEEADGFGRPVINFGKARADFRKYSGVTEWKVA